MDLETHITHVNGIPVIEFFPAETAQPAPLLILMHGFNGRKQDLWAQGQSFAGAGFFAVSADLHRHGELGETPFIPARVSPYLDEVIEQSAENIEKIIAGYSDVKTVFLLGVSLGGAVIYRYLPKRNPVVRAAACMVAGCDPFWETTFQRIRQLYPQFGITDELLAKAAEIVQNRPFLAGLRDFPLLMQYGKQDPIVPIAEVRKVYEQIRRGYGQADRLRLTEYEPCGHETPPAMYEEALAWFRQG
jgi:pimeloyl-ACP methyl ester carboxylesterase